MFLSKTMISVKPSATRLGLRTVKPCAMRLGLRTAWAGSKFKGTWTGSKSKGNKYLEQLKRESVDDMETDKSKDILRRTRVIACEKECEKIVDRILRKGDPIGVDMEGVVQGITGMIQVCDTDRNIFLFRTSFNRSLYRSGRLADLLESPYLVKILHASAVDCQSVYKDKVKMWNIYDTCVAHKVFRYQTNGVPITSTPQIGLNDLCTFCGLDENPLKKKAKDLLWKMLIFNRVLDETEDLGPELILYSAWDVEPLHEIYNTFDVLIDPDYRHLVQQVSDFDLIRSIDADLVKKKRENLKNVEKCGVFLSKLGHRVVKPDIYQLVSTQPGNKHVYFSNSNNAANVVLDSRFSALNLYKLYSDRKLPHSLGPNAKLELVVNVHPEEIGEDIKEEDKEAERNDSWVTSPKLCAEMVGIMMDAKAPIVVDFLKMPSSVMVLEMYVGVMPCIKIAVTADLITEGRLGDLLSSSDVPKVIGRLDADNVYSMLKLLASHDIYMENVFEIISGWKSLDYLHHGQSFFKIGSRSIPSICDQLGIERDVSGQVSKLDWHLLCYTQLMSVIPAGFREVLAERAKVELSIGANLDAVKNKVRRKQIKDRIDTHCVHFRVSGKSYKKEMSSLKSFILEYLVRKNFVMMDYIEVERCALVELQSYTRVLTVLEDFSSGALDLGNINVAVTSPRLVKECLEKPPVQPVLIENLRSEIAKGLLKLKDGGLLHLMERHNPPRATVALKQML